MRGAIRGRAASALGEQDDDRGEGRRHEARGDTKEPLEAAAVHGSAP
jgi:hypothetical protein